MYNMTCVSQTMSDTVNKPSSRSQGQSISHLSFFPYLPWHINCNNWFPIDNYPTSLSWGVPGESLGKATTKFVGNAWMGFASDAVICLTRCKLQLLLGKLKQHLTAHLCRDLGSLLQFDPIHGTDSIHQFDSYWLSALWCWTLLHV